MKNLILSAIFAVVAFSSNAQTRIINVYEVATFSKNALTNSFDAFYEPDEVGDTIKVSKRFIINFSDSTFIEYADGEKITEGKIDIVSELLPNSDQFFILFIDSNNHVRGINNSLNLGLLFEQRDNITYIESFEKFSIN